MRRDASVLISARALEEGKTLIAASSPMDPEKKERMKTNAKIYSSLPRNAASSSTMSPSHLACMAIHCVFVNGLSMPSLFSLATVLLAPL